MAFSVFLLTGLFIVNPNEGKVLQLFGQYVGTVKEPGLRYANPLYRKRRISLRVRNFESGKLKVNDLDGNPIEIARRGRLEGRRHGRGALRSGQLRELRPRAERVGAAQHGDQLPVRRARRRGAMSLRGHTAAIADHLRKEIQDRLARAGVEVVEARISHLAYAPEIAAAMLQRQQAGAIIAARSRIVEGAVGMVEMALDMLSKKNVVTLDEERKAAMVSNLLVVLCGERDTQPVVNAGTLHH